ncbi:MAG: hypothetical protein AAB889_04150, partial [Patescibacteria group bacterium]
RQGVVSIIRARPVTATSAENSLPTKQLESYVKKVDIRHQKKVTSWWKEKSKSSAITTPIENLFLVR